MERPGFGQRGVGFVEDLCDTGEPAARYRHDPAERVISSGEAAAQVIVELYNLAVAKQIPVTEPFAGEVRFDGALRIFGPSVDFYRGQLSTELAGGSVVAELSAAFSSFATRVAVIAKTVLERVLSSYPVETLTNADETSARNTASVITLVQTDAKRMLFTGDAGIPSLDRAADEYERLIGFFSSYPLTLFQAPHHGSHRNVGPEILDRLLGTEEHPFGSPSAIISSAKLSEKHPSPKVANPLGRRGASVNVTEGKTVCYGATGRVGWVTQQPLPPLEEDE